MIEFSGEISKECRRYILRRESRCGMIVGLWVASIFIIPVIIAMRTVHWIHVLWIPVLIIFVLLSGLPVKKNNYSVIIPSKVSILEDGTMISESEKFHWIEDVSYVKNVIDYGGWYHIYFFYTHRNQRFICDKSIITKGTLEEFEKLFEGKIERKNNLKT